MNKNKIFYAMEVNFGSQDFKMILNNSPKELKLNNFIKDFINRVIDFRNVQVMKISEDLKLSEPRIFEKQELKELVQYLNGFAVVTPLPCHRVALQHAFDAEGISNKIEWISGARIMRRINFVSNKEEYKEYREHAYDIKKIAKLAGISYENKNGICIPFSKILCKILKDKKTTLIDLHKEIKELKNIRSDKKNIKREGAPNCLFTGKKLKISGKIPCGKLDGANLAAGLGFDVTDYNNKVSICVASDSAQQKPTNKVNAEDKYDHLMTGEDFIKWMHAA